MQTKSKFKVGDIVVPKCGGPEMAVSEVGADQIGTFWFSGKKKESGSFPPETLTLAASSRALDVSKLTAEQRDQLRALLKLM